MELARFHPRYLHPNRFRIGADDESLRHFQDLAEGGSVEQAWRDIVGMFGDLKMGNPLLVASLLSLFLVIGAAQASAQGGGGGFGPGGGRDFVPGSGTGTGRDFGPGSGTGMGRDFGPGSGTRRGRCRIEEVRVCRGGAGDGRGPRCRIVRRERC